MGALRVEGISQEEAGHVCMHGAEDVLYRGLPGMVTGSEYGNVQAKKFSVQCSINDASLRTF